MKNKELIGHTVFTGAIGILLLLRWLKVIESVFGVDIAIILTIVGGYKIFLEAITGIFKSIRNIEWDISADLAVAIAAVAALAIRQYTAAAEVVFIMIVGEGLELFGVVKTRGAIGKLMALSPQTACVKRDGVEERIPVEEVEPGDIVVVRQGERIPVDGEVIRGSSSVDQSTITGESMPVEKAVGDEAFTGTMNQFGVLEIETRSVGEDTVLGRIVHLVEEAQESKAPVERTVDRYARYFVPIVLTIAAIVFLITRDVTRSVAVLIVACPCSLILATPTAVVAGIGRLARSGILVKGGTYLEGIGKADCLVFDKTGTLTLGKPRIAEIVTFGDYGENDLLAVAAAAEQGSEHLLAELVVAEAQERNIHIPGADDFLMKPGMGVEARSGNRGILVGNRKLLLANNVEISPEVETDLDRLDSEGHTIALVAVRAAEDDYVVAGVIAIDDELRPESASTISSLKSLGVDRFVLLTGDNERSAARIARRAGIDDVAANLLPDEKVSKIRELQKAGLRTAMVGDGVNDAPSLAVADVGIVMGGIGADVTMEAADIVLMADDLSKLSELVKLSRQAVRTIKQNILYFAIIFNGLALVAASVGLIGPVGAAVVHQIGSVMVVLNSLRLLITGGAKRGAS